MKAYYVPNGPKNLGGLFPGINFANVAEYYIQVLDGTDTVIATGTRNILENSNCCTDKVRLHFLQYLGATDAINFKKIITEHEAQSDVMQKLSTSKSQHHITRYNVKANDVHTLSCIDYREEDQEWLQELVDSPLVWMEWTGVQGQLDGYIPVIVLDSKFVKRKEEERYVYELILQVLMSHEKKIIRA